MSEPWPEVVWSSPLLRGLDARGRREVAAAGALLERAPGEALFTEGAPADALFVILEGEVGLSALGRGKAVARIERRMRPGDALGEEALLGPHAVRDGDAVATRRVVAASVPCVVLTRALVRAGGAELEARTSRAVRRRLLERRLAVSGLTAGLGEGPVGELLDMAEHRDVARGEVVFGAGERARALVFVLDGLLSTHEIDDGGKLAPVGYVGRGDLFDPGAGPLPVTLAGAGPSAVALFPAAGLARAFAGREDAIAAVGRGALPARIEVDGGTTAHVVKDLYRVQIAGSLLVIDPSSCVRCGHCVWSCGAAHEDGVPRLTRRGDKLLVPTSSGASPLFLPNSCQHCKNPACLKECPTGAIVRDGRGEVKIREELCTGCGNCARGCPWENIQVVPRSPRRPAVAGSEDVARVASGVAVAFPDVAVKCDLCEGLAGGPACVASCPTDAIARLDPLASGVASVAPGPLLPPPRPAWPWVVAGVPAALALSRLALSPRTSGALALALSAVAAGYVAAKRVSPRAGAGAGAVRSRLRPHYVGHLVVGVLTLGAVAAHARAVAAPHAAGGAALVLWLVAAVTGGLAALLYRLVPSRIARLEREATLPEDLAPAREENSRAVFRALSGRSELVKRLYDKVLAPYRRQPLGGVALALSGRSVGAEERRVRKDIDGLLEGRGQGKLEGTGALVRLAVEARALDARAGLGGLLRAFVPAHVAAVAAFLVVAVVHAWLSWRSGP